MKTSLSSDNRGLTLIELIVAVTILAIIVVPILHAFVTGAGTERKSQIYGDATNAAQNLIEQIQATDADSILKNANAVASGASFYTYNGTDGTYTSVGQTASKSNVYYLGIPNFKYGDSTFDALITMDVTDAINSKDVSVSNSMGAYLDMSAADANAEAVLKAECGGLVDPSTLTAEILTRSITMNIPEPVTANTYTIDVSFDYTATISYTGNDEGNKPITLKYSFAHTEKSSASVIPDANTVVGSPIFSAYMFFDGYKKANISAETILINNKTGSDINIFIVNTSKVTAPATFSELVWYKYQNFNDVTPVNSLVFTNLPAKKVEYRASKNELLKKTLPVTGYLVEMNKFERKFKVNVSLYNVGSDFKGSPVLSINSTKLN